MAERFVAKVDQARSEVWFDVVDSKTTAGNKHLKIAASGIIIMLGDMTPDEMATLGEFLVYASGVQIVTEGDTYRRAKPGEETHADSDTP